MFFPLFWESRYFGYYPMLFKHQTYDEISQKQEETDNEVSRGLRYYRKELQDPITGDYNSDGLGSKAKVLTSPQVTTACKMAHC